MRLTMYKTNVKANLFDETRNNFMRSKLCSPTFHSAPANVTLTLRTLKDVGMRGQQLYHSMTSRGANVANN